MIGVSKFILLQFILGWNSLKSSAVYIPSKIPLWSWECQNEKCVPNRSTLNLKPQSLETCNMLCGSAQLWPQPTGSTDLSKESVPVQANNFKLETLATPSRAIDSLIRETFELFKQDIIKMQKTFKNATKWITVNVKLTINGSGDPRMNLNTAEDYKLIMWHENNIKVEITAKSFCGARHALETLSQLVWYDPYEESLYILDSASIEDSPRFNYRGVLIDTARKYFTVDMLKHVIDAMSACKLNTFHWHISDSQAFSVRLRNYPALATYDTLVYSVDDVRVIVRYARVRGIRVLLEIDLPAHIGHQWDWGPDAGLGVLALCADDDSWKLYCEEPPCGQLNPRNLNIYKILENIYAEMISLTGITDLFHLGGDDVSSRCWTQHFNSTDPMQLWLQFTRGALHALETANRVLPNLTILWSSPLNDYLKDELREYFSNLGLQTRAMTWEEKYVTGLRTVLSNEDVWDLNSEVGAWYVETVGVPYNSWQHVYEHRPWARGGMNLVIGGEVTMWSSTVSIGGLDARLWPRAAAFAERMWSDRAEGVTRSVKVRLDVHRSRLRSRGIQVSPLWSMWCTQNPFTCT